ncbi:MULTISPECIES: polysaccharide biosynthesis protein [Sphingomonadales]|nr:MULTISPECIES: nucleoside-diphosphate sugar epimerase/dehydratase [Sphingomonadaceae]PCF90081.1 polysaccharide biosynthesis protein [Sphingopyxis terrae subsp. ummariensis]SMQ79477.1 NDP-sugar epimerase, includes UDP-GlcNAc-inverting 4,6-dehydratase FlaA1 and capsular polysaccharide biosynthesis protein EpsC [Sphingopyxis terrae subsp. ummariensis]
MTRETQSALLNALEALTSLPRSARKWMVFGFDCLLCLIAAWVALALRLGEWPHDLHALLILTATTLLFWTIIAWPTGLYRNLIRFSGARASGRLFYACAMLGIPLTIIFGFIQIDGVPRTIAVLHPIIFFLLMLFMRLSLRFVVSDYLHLARGRTEERRRLLIYGAGRGGQQLANSLRQEPHLLLVGYIDDDERLSNQQLDGITVWHSSILDSVLEERRVNEVVLAIPSALRVRRREIVEALQARKIRVRMLPGIGQLIDGHFAVNDIRDVQVEDLLGRDAVAPNELLMGRSLLSKNVLVTGAGGSIGSELCRQIIHSRPKRLILVEQSEYFLYAIESELRRLALAEGCELELIPELADVADKDSVFRIFRRWQPETVYHAAAYKHVPLVESNPIAGMRNNIFSTLYCALAAEAVGVRRFILVSTDKAVRPTNVMGASKRVCELILQARAQEQDKTLFTMVRFGNVLGSSGSVVPLFKQQIAAGGPVTITHKDVTRYFMTIPEASQLVIQAGGMAEGGEVFVLDMGQPVLIRDLAETMVRLSGLTVRDAATPEGDVEIIEVGLRPGEKLYEELLIGDNPAPTVHSRIMQAREAVHPWNSLSDILEGLADRLRQGDVSQALSILHKLVPEYHRPTHKAAAPNLSI